jgi:hypothetical protein
MTLALRTRSASQRHTPIRRLRQLGALPAKTAWLHVNTNANAEQFSGCAPLCLFTP